MLQRLFRLLPALWGNWISLLGTTLTTVGANIFLIFLVVDFVKGLPPYAAAISYLVAPPLFVGGLLLIALGAWRQRRRIRVAAAAGRALDESPISRAVHTVMSDPQSRRRVIFVLVGTVVNITLVSVAAYEGVSYMSSTGFCGQLCHTVMEPEYAAYSRSAHARVPCVDCHVGEGASWFVRSKLSGVGQVWAVTTGKFSRPIQTPVHALRPARETCERCHWPQKFHGERLIVRHNYKSDEKNTRQTNVVRLNVGGINKRTDRYEGIHWHVSPGVKITYEALDRRRAKIGKIEVKEAGQADRVYLPAAAKGKAAAGAPPAERRLMDCVDCHNRPTHIYDPSPEVAVDRALTDGKIDATLPFVRKQGIELLKTSGLDPVKAADRFSTALQAFYQQRYPELARTKAAAIRKAGRELGWIFRRNIYPRMRITWGTYPSHLGHRSTTEGCFRCHDDEHTQVAKAKDNKAEGKKLSQDCDLCHEVMAEDEEKPDVPKSLLRLGRM